MQPPAGSLRLLSRPAIRAHLAAPTDWPADCIWKSLKDGSQSEDLLTEREVCPLKCQNDLHAKAKSSQGSKFPGYPRSKDTLYQLNESIGINPREAAAYSSMVQVNSTHAALVYERDSAAHLSLVYVPFAK